MVAFVMAEFSPGLPEKSKLWKKNARPVPECFMRLNRQEVGVPRVNNARIVECSSGAVFGLVTIKFIHFLQRYGLLENFFTPVHRDDSGHKKGYLAKLFTPINHAFRSSVGRSAVCKQGHISPLVKCDLVPGYFGQ
jgi:hypothetical protein